MCRFSIYFDCNFAIFPADEGVQKGNLAIAFSFDGEDLRILGSMEFKVSWKAEMASVLMMTKLSSTYLFQILGGTMELIRAESSITSIQRLATTGLNKWALWALLVMQATESKQDENNKEENDEDKKAKGFGSEHITFLASIASRQDTLHDSCQPELYYKTPQKSILVQRIYLTIMYTRSINLPFFFT